MDERILELIDAFNIGINRVLFFKLLSHSTDGNSDVQSHSNSKDIGGWLDLYNKEFVQLGVNANQIEIFFNYMSTHHHHFFTKDNGRFSVNKYFDKTEKAKENFQFEEIVLSVLELL